jgi:hypothetical protein
MALKSGFSEKIINANIESEMKRGKSRKEATASAIQNAVMSIELERKSNKNTAFSNGSRLLSGPTPRKKKS